MCVQCRATKFLPPRTPPAVGEARTADEIEASPAFWHLPRDFRRVDIWVPGTVAVLSGCTQAVFIDNNSPEAGISASLLSNESRHAPPDAGRIIRIFAPPVVLFHAVAWPVLGFLLSPLYQPSRQALKRLFQLASLAFLSVTSESQQGGPFVACLVEYVHPADLARRWGIMESQFIAIAPC